MGTTMILQDLVIPSKKNLRLKFSGIDSLDRCPNKEHFQSYPHKVEYVYNSRGFRDAEWPDSLDELKDAIWCVGDSFTVGIGSSYHFIWPQVLSAVTGRRCINVSMDGASNNWISRRAQQIVREVAPTHMVMLWSYFHRREHPDTNLFDDCRVIHSDRSSSYQDDVDNFINCYDQLINSKKITRMWHGAIPDCSPRPADRALTWLKNLDYARDAHHFDLATSKFFVQEICKNLFNSNH